MDKERKGFQQRVMSFAKKRHKIRLLIKEITSSVVVLGGRLYLYLLGVRYGQGLFLEGSIDVTEPQNIQLGKNVRLGKNIYLGVWPEGELVVGDDTYIGRWTIVLAHQSVIIGNDCRIAPGCHITDVNHGIAPGVLIKKQPLVSKPIRIGNDVWIGAGCSILPGVTIGDGAVVGARAVVTHDVPTNTVVVGIPAKFLRSRSDDD